MCAGQRAGRWLIDGMCVLFLTTAALESQYNEHSSTMTLFIQHSVCLLSFFFRSHFLSQTKDALFTILRDLRPGDRFNIISFSNKIKVWQPNRLVEVTPLTVRDAKKFIFTLATTGGQNSTILIDKHDVCLD